MTEELRLIISAEIDKLREELQKGQKDLKNLEKQGGKSSKGLVTSLQNAGKAIGTAMKVIGAAFVAAGTALTALAESTREYRTQQAMLATAFQTTGGSAEVAKETYDSLYRVLGDTGQASEAAQHLAQLTSEEEALAEWTNICQGVYATFGASLPIEALTEAANETAKTGELTGALADALNWAGVNEEEFKDQLWLCNTEAEREALIRQTLTGLYGDAASAYETNAKAVLDANEAQGKLNDSMAQAGGAVEPLITVVKNGLANALSGLVPHLATVTEGVADVINGVEGGADKMSAGVQALLDAAISTITGALPIILQAGVQIISALIEGIVNSLPDILQAVADILPQIITTLGTLIPMITEAILTALPMIIETIIQAAGQILVTLGEIIPEILAQIVAILPQIVQAITDNIPVLLQAAITFLMAIVDAIPQIIPPLVAAIPTIIQSILEAVTTAIPMLIEAALALFTAIIDAIPIIIPAIIEALPQIIVSIVDCLINNLPVLLEGAVQLFMAIVLAIPKIIPQLITGLGQIVSTVITTLANKLGDIFKGIWDGLVKGGKAALEGIKTAFTSIPNWFKNIFSSAWTAVKNVFSAGGKIFDGIKDGILNGLKTVINGIIKGINKVIKVPFDGINSALKKIKSIEIVGIKPFDWMPTISVPQIPQLAKGGVLERGQVGLLEGSGAEAVVPLENNDKWLTEIAKKLGGMLDGNDRDIILQVDGTVLARTSIKSINQLTRQTGKLDLVLA